MSDGDKSKPRRLQSQTERDTEGIQARKERDATRGIPGPFESDDLTGQYEGEELERARAKRPTDERLTRLERKSDMTSEQLAEHAMLLAEQAGAIGEANRELGNVKGAIGDMGAKMDLWPKLVDQITKTNQETLTELRSQAHYKFTATVDVGKEGALSDIKVRETKELDAVDEKKAKRKWITKAVEVAGAIAIAILTILQARSC